jgi:hypothetical protein
MSQPTPARLYCTLVGAALVIAGLIGFFYSASFDSGSIDVRADSDEVFGLLAVNGWHNLVHIALGLLALAVAGSVAGARAYCLGIGLVYLVLAIWGFIDSDGVLIGLIPVNDPDNVLHLILGLVGLGAGAATPTAEPRPKPKARRERPGRAKPAAEDA